MVERSRSVNDHRVKSACKVAVLWIDWYAYHVARFRGLEGNPVLAGQVVGLEMVGGIGVHAGLKFREALPADLPVQTLMPQTSWAEADKFTLARMVWARLTILDPQIVLVPGYYTLPAIAAALWARVHGRQSVLMTESTAFDHQRVGWKELLKKTVIRILFSWAITGGKAHVNYLRQLGFPADRIAGGYDVVDNERISLGVEAARIGHVVSPYFLYVGRLAEEKNVEGLLNSWRQYRNEGGTWPLVLVGDGPLKTKLETSAAASEFADHVSFPGLKSSSELMLFYAFAGCFVLPSSREPWGLVVNEAMAAGLPVLVSNRCGCCADLVEGGNGFTFAPEDAQELTRLLHTMEQLTAEQRRQMGSRSLAIVSRYSPRDFGNAVASIVESSLAKKSLQTLREAGQ